MKLINAFCLILVFASACTGPTIQPVSPDAQTGTQMVAVEASSSTSADTFAITPGETTTPNSSQEQSQNPIPTVTPSPASTATPIYGVDLFAPAGDKLLRLAYARNLKQKWELVVSDLRTNPASITVVATSDREISNLSWSPDAKWIAYYVYDTSLGGDFIWLASSDGSTPARQLSSKEFSVTHELVWSPDSRYLFFSGMKGGIIFGLDDPLLTVHLWRLDIESGQLLRLTSDELEGTNILDLSPDGKLIAFDCDGSIWLMTAEGGDVRRLTRTNSWWDSNPAWAPDNQQLIFIRTTQYVINDTQDPDGPAGLWTVDLSGNSRLLKKLPVSFYPVGKRMEFSPDLNWIALVFDNPSNGVGSHSDDIYLFSMQTSELIKVNNNSSNNYFTDWSPDSHSFLYTNHTESGVCIYLGESVPKSGRRFFDHCNNRDAVWEPPLNREQVSLAFPMADLPVNPTPTLLPTPLPDSTRVPQPMPILSVQKPDLETLKAYFEGLPPSSALGSDFLRAAIYPLADYMEEDISGDGRADLVKYKILASGQKGDITSAIVYQDLSGDGIDDILFYDGSAVPAINGWLYILIWDGENYLPPYIQEGPGSLDNSAESSFWFEDVTQDGIPEIMHKTSETSKEGDLRFFNTNQAIIHCAQTGCREAWSGLISNSTVDSRSAGISKQTVKLKPFNGPVPSIQVLSSGFSVYCCGATLPADSVVSDLVIFATTSTVYSWTGEVFEVTSVEEARPRQVISDDSQLEAFGKGKRKATITWSPGNYTNPYDDQCQLNINDVKIGSAFACRHQFTRVEWKDINADEEPEVIIITYTSNNMYDFSGRAIGKLTCAQQHLFVYEWDKKDGEFLRADINGCIMQADLFGVRLKDADEDGIFEILAVADPISGMIQEYRWDGRFRYVYYGEY